MNRKDLAKWIKVEREGVEFLIKNETSTELIHYYKGELDILHYLEEYMFKERLVRRDPLDLL